MRRAHTRARFIRSRTSSPAPPQNHGWPKMTTTLPEIAAIVPGIFLGAPLLQDNESTPTSEAQQATLDECLPLMGAVTDPSQNPFDYNESGFPHLNRDDHIDFCHENLAQFPAPFVGLDASRPWLVYWGLLSLYLLGEDVVSLRQR